MIRGLEAILLGTALSCATFAGAQAQTVYRAVVAPVHGYAEPAIRGDYIGAPFARFPRPDQLVPSAWGYGTYGVPTVAGIHAAPVGTPTVYVIDAPVVRRRESPSRAHAGRHRTERSGGATAIGDGEPRIVSVSVPPRQASLR